MRLKRYVWLILGIALLLTPTPVLVLASPVEQDGQNLLNNPGFEGNWHWQGDSYLGKIADGWVAWWVDDASGKGASDPTYWKNQRPEYGLIGLEYHIPDQIHSGGRALQYGKRYATHTAGVYQQVSGIAPGTKLSFSAWGFIFGKDPDPNRTPGYARMKVGIDPGGGTNPFAGSVVWSGIVNPVAVGGGSAWRQMSVDAVATNSTVTVFLYSSPEWPMDDALTSQWDDTILVGAGQAAPPTGTAPPPPPTRPPGTPLPPPATATPRPDGSIVHVVRSGETVWAIAIQYSTGSNSSAEEMLGQINTLNNNPTLIYPGQELVIAIPGDGLAAQVQTPVSDEESAPAPLDNTEQAIAAVVPSGEQSAASAATAGNAPDAASSSTLCVSAYNDRNSNSMRDPTTEELLANASFVLSSDKGTVGSYTSDGTSEPYCFTQLIAGTYMVQLTKAGGYNTTTPEYWAVALQGGATANVEFGHHRDPNAPESGTLAAPGGGRESEAENPGRSEGASQADGESGSQSLLSSLGEIAVGVSGVFVLLLAAAVGVAFVASRRRE